MALSMTFRKRAIGAFVAGAYLFSLLGAPALAQHVLPVLGTAPLLGAMNSTTELQLRVQQRHAMFVTAAMDLGLSNAETAELIDHIMSGQVRWVRIPRHLDAMTWAWDGSVYMYRDVLIPGGEYGWETDIHDGPNVHALFIPAACGNLSLVERSAPIAYVVPPPLQPPSCPSGMMGNPPNCYAPQCPAGMMGTPPNCYAPQCPPGTMQGPGPGAQPAPGGPPGPGGMQPGGAPACYAPTPPPQLTVVVKSNTKIEAAWWLIPIAFLGFFVGGHYHYSPPPPPPPQMRCPPAVDPP